MNFKIAAIFVLGIALMACQPATQTNNSTTPANNANANKSNTNTTDAAKKSPPTDFNKLAERIVTQSAGVKEGEIVLISGGLRDLELLENLFVEVRKVGAEPFLSMGTERITKRSYTDVPEKFDTQVSKLDMALAKTVNVTINVDSSETQDLLADIPPARLAARSKAGAAIGLEFIKNKVRNVSVGNELYPTEWRAKRFDVPLDNFAKMFWEGVNIDYTNLQAQGDKARNALAGKELEITHPNGTSLKVNLDSKPAYISDGIVSPEDVQTGNLDVFLPAGEAAVLPAANSGDGKFVVEKQYFQGKEISNLTLTFTGGKLTAITGEGPGFAPFKADFDLRDEGKDILSFIDLGINPNYTLPAGSKLGNWVSAGMVTLGTGNNTWAGGSNNSTGGTAGHLSGATVKIDGKTIVENGVLKL